MTELPHWWGPRQRAKNTLIYYCVLAAIAFARFLPLFILRATGGALTLLGFLLPLRERRRAVRQLREAGFAHPWRITFHLYLHFGRLGADWVKLDSVVPSVEFPDEAKQVLRDALAEGRGVLAVTPHLGNWELLAQASAFHGFRCTTIAKPLYDPRLTAIVSDFRERAGVTTLWRGQGPLTERLSQVMRDGKVLGVLIDQDTKVASLFIPFFHKLASTPIVPQSLALKQNAPVVFGYCALRHGRYYIHYERLPAHTNVEALTRDLNARTETAIRKHPEQWVWIHDRWKRQPS